MLACIGSAVGLGNIWRFAYVCGENGGGAFLLAYFLYLLVLGLPLMLAEASLGRYTRGDLVSAIGVVSSGWFWKIAALLIVAGSVLVLGYYATIAGWVIHYFSKAVGGSLWALPPGMFEAHFDTFLAHWTSGSAS